MSEEEKVALIYKAYGYTSTLKRLSDDARRTLEETERRILSDLLSSGIGLKLLERIRSIIRDEIRMELSQHHGNSMERCMEEYDGKT